MKINNKNNVALLLIIVGVILFFMFVMPMVDKNYYNQENFDSAPVDSTNNDNIVKLDTKKCSSSCCGLAQWPVPSEIHDPSISQDELKNYIPSNFSCTSGEYSGCLCMTQNNSDYLNNHGNNKP
jgi:hypothetical protein